jgi:Xaa-Pro dipeptidase
MRNPIVDDVAASAAGTAVAAGGPLAPADEAERARRYEGVRARMAEADLDVLLAFAPGWRRENVRYLTDAPVAASAAMALLPAAGEPSAFSARRADLPVIAASGWVPDVHPLALTETGAVNGTNALADRLRATRPKRVGVAHLELLPLVLARAVRRAVPAAQIVSATALMDDVRLVKSEWEIAKMRLAAEVCAAGWRAFVDVLEPGLPEYRIVAAVESELKRLGAEDNFMLIASGGDEVRGMTPPGSRLLEPGDMVRTELTPQLNGYWLQICRSAVVGAPSEGQRRSFELFNAAVEAGLSVVRPGVTAHEVATAQNDVFRERGYGEYCTSQYTRVRGHGHGLHLDETPIIEGNHTVLPAGAVFIVHPNTYTPLAGYHVLGDPVLVTETGHEVLVGTERKLFSTGEDDA